MASPFGVVAQRKRTTSSVGASGPSPPTPISHAKAASASASGTTSATNVKLKQSSIESSMRDARTQPACASPTDASAAAPSSSAVPTRSASQGGTVLNKAGANTIRSYFQSVKHTSATAAANEAADAAAMPPPPSPHVPLVRSAAHTPMRSQSEATAVKRTPQPPPQLHAHMQLDSTVQPVQPPAATTSAPAAPVAAVAVAAESDPMSVTASPVLGALPPPSAVMLQAALSDELMLQPMSAAATADANTSAICSTDEFDSSCDGSFVSPLPSPTRPAKQMRPAANFTAATPPRPSSRASPAASPAQSPSSRGPTLLSYAPSPTHHGHSRAASVGGIAGGAHRRSGSSAGASPIDSRYLSRLASPSSPSPRGPSAIPSRGGVGGSHARAFSFGLTSLTASSLMTLSSPVRGAAPSPSSSTSSLHSTPSSTSSPLSVTPSLRALQEVAAGLDVSDRFIPHRRGSNLQHAGYGLGLGQDDDAMQENAAPHGVTITNASHPNAHAPGSAAAAAALNGAATGAAPAFSSAYGVLLRSEILGSSKSGAGGAVGGSCVSGASVASMASAGERQPFNSQLVVHRQGATPVGPAAADSVAAAGAPASNAAAASTAAAAASPHSSPSPSSSSLHSLPPTYRFASPRRPNPLSSSPWWSPSATSLTPDTQRLLGRLKSPTRVISKLPFKVLDAPNIRDDFYLNLVDWGQQNVVAVALGAAVYLWSGTTGKVSKLLDLDDAVEQVTSVAWTMRGTHLAVGLRSGGIQIWDANKAKCVRTLPGHTARVGSMAWNSHVLASGSRDRSILLHDPRAASVGGAASSSGGGSVAARLLGHKQEVCGLKWSYDEQQLASGGNDNKLLIWSAHAHSAPLHRFEEHTAAVKAIAWSPHQHGLLCSGGGTADRCIRFWSTQGAGASLSHIDTGSQVCNLLWSRNCNEIVSTHGYSLNQIVCWQYPSMQQITTLTGHTMRVLFLAVSPCGQTILTGAGDETLRFWNLFPNSESKGAMGSASSLVLPTNADTMIR